jgi:hypothetical protein
LGGGGVSVRVRVRVRVSFSFFSFSDGIELANHPKKDLALIWGTFLLKGKLSKLQKTGE